MNEETPIGMDPFNFSWWVRSTARNTDHHKKMNTRLLLFSAQVGFEPPITACSNPEEAPIVGFLSKKEHPDVTGTVTGNTLSSTNGDRA